MRPFVAIALIFFAIALATALEFLNPVVNQIVSPILFIALGFWFWHRQVLRWLYLAAIFVSVIPELQAQVLGPLEVHHALILVCTGFVGLRWLFFAPRQLPRLSTALLWYYAVLVLVTLINLGTIQSWHRLTIVLFMILLALLAPFFITNKKAFTELLVTLFTASLAKAAIALIALYIAVGTNSYFESPYLHMSITEGVPRLAGTLLDSNFLGNFLLLALPAGIGLLLAATRKPRISLTIATILIGAVFLLTYSRSAYLGLAAALVVLVVLLRRRAWVRVLLLLGSLVITATALYPSFPAFSVYRTPSALISTSIKEKILLGFDARRIANDYIAKVRNDPRLSDEERDALLARDVSSDSLGYRLLFWKAGFQMFKDRPIFGVGVGQFRYQFKNYASLQHIREPDTHNIFIEQLAETGLMGFALFAIVLLLTIRNFWRASKSPQAWVRAVGVIGLASFVGVLVQSTLLGGLGAVPIYLLWGVASSLEMFAANRGNLSRANVGPIRIAFVTATTRRDGPGNMLGLLIKHLDRNKFEPIVLTILGGGEWDQEYEHLKVQRVNLALRKPLDLMAPLFLWWQLRRLKPDLVHTQMIRADAYGRWAAIRKGVPVVTAVHNIDNWKRSKKPWHRLMTWVDAQCLATTHHVVAVSRAVQNHLVDRHGVLLDQTTVVANGIDFRAFEGAPVPATGPSSIRNKLGISDRDIIVGTTARVAKQKAPEVWLSAALQVLAKHKNVHFVWAGSGPLLHAMQGIVHNRGLKNIHFIGQIKNIPQFLGEMDIYTLASRFEGLPLALLEAMGAGVACIASNVAGNPELITHEQSGLLVPPESSEALASAIEQLIKDKELRQQLARAGQKFVRENFTPEIMATGYANVYTKIIPSAHLLT